MQGHRPQNADEVAVDRKTASDGNLKIGDQVKVSFLTVAPKTYTLVGTFEFGGSENGLAGATMAAFTPPEAQRVTNRVGPVGPSRRPRRLGGLADRGPRQHPQGPRGLRRQQEVPGADRRRLREGAGRTSIKDNLSFFNIFLLVFALIALFVGAFIIYNTFSITVQQRARELGLLRALGASGRQVVGSVALEAIVVGVFSSVVGLVLGIAIVKPLEVLFSAFGVDLPSGLAADRAAHDHRLAARRHGHHVRLAPSRRRAGRPGSRRSRRCATRRRAPARAGAATCGAAIVSVLGLIALFAGLFGNSSGNSGAILVGVAALLVFIGVADAQPADRPARGPAPHVAGGADEEHHRAARPRERDAEPAPDRVHVGRAR